jgi:hypothetical protein
LTAAGKLRERPPDRRFELVRRDEDSERIVREIHKADSLFERTFR